MSGLFSDEEMVRPRSWAEKIFLLPPKEWTAMFRLVPDKYKSLVRTHVGIFLGQTIRSESRRTEILDAYLTVERVDESHVQAVSRGEGDSSDGQSQGEEIRTAHANNPAAEPAGISDDKDAGQGGTGDLFLSA